MVESTTTRARGDVGATVDAVVAVGGMGTVAVVVLHAHAPVLPVVLIIAIVVGVMADRLGYRLCRSSWPGLLTIIALTALLPWGLTQLLLSPVSPLSLSLMGTGALGAAIVRQCTVQRGVAGVVGGALLLMTASAAPAQSWSIDEPGGGDPRVVAGNGIVPALDTHAFLLARGVTILDNDGHTTVAGFLTSPDPTAPAVHQQSEDRPTGEHESYVWRMQRGSLDADRSHKPDMPDHFFNWWTHSGKGLVAGPSAATYAEEQFAQAVRLWQKGDQSQAMYHLGAATHLVQDGCAPPHATVLVPEHRAYEDWVMAQQSRMTATSGGIYRDQFRLTSGHGGPQWSSSHTRGWVDECAHRAAQLIPNVVRPPTTGAVTGEAQDKSIAHLRETARLTAGYLAFFFDEVDGPR